MTLPSLWFKAGTNHSRIEWMVVEKEPVPEKHRKARSDMGWMSILGILLYQYELQDSRNQKFK